MRTLLAAAAAVLLLPLCAAPAHAAGVRVTVADMAFSPAAVRVGLGESVTWTFADPVSHTATSDAGFFDTGAASGGQTRSVRFVSAGRYAYHCSFHPMMHGSVAVPVAVNGSEQDGWRLRWRVGSNPAGRTYDVQVRRVGATAWRVLRTATAAAAARFSPASGSWQVRARTVDGSAASGWSPAVRLR